MLVLVACFNVKVYDIIFLRKGKGWALNPRRDFVDSASMKYTACLVILFVVVELNGNQCFFSLFRRGF